MLLLSLIKCSIDTYNVLYGFYLFPVFLIQFVYNYSSVEENDIIDTFTSIITVSPYGTVTN